MRLSLLVLALSGVLVAASACSDATAPSRLVAPGGPVASRDLQEAQPSARTGATTFQATIDPHKQNVLRFGTYTLTLPANSVCNLDRSGYGIDVFDDRCSPEGQDVTIRATVSRDAQGHQRIDLSPRMRFNPTKTVILSTYVGDAALLSSASWGIFFCPDSDTSSCIDESLTDSSLVTQIDLQQGIIFRRIKHFSGYLAAES